MNMEDVDCAGSSLSQNHNSATSQSLSLYHGRPRSSQSRHHRGQNILYASVQFAVLKPVRNVTYLLKYFFLHSSPGVSQSLSATSGPAAPRHQSIGSHPGQPARLGLWRPWASAAPFQQPAVLQHLLHCLRLFPGASFVHNRASGFSHRSASLQPGVFLQLHTEPAVWQEELLQRLGHLGPLCSWRGKHQRYAVLKLRQHRPGPVLSLESGNAGEMMSLRCFYNDIQNILSLNHFQQKLARMDPY